MTKRILTIGDIHGKTVWEKMIKSEYDTIVFLGDYVDDFPPTTDNQIYDNLLRIIEVKKENPNQVVLLWGNHEQHYLFGPNKYRCSGYRFNMFKTLNSVLNKNRDLFQYAYQYKDHIWTHAGIHDGWWRYRFNTKKEKITDIAGVLNAEFAKKTLVVVEKKTETLFDCGYDRGGNEKIGGPLWVDRSTIWESGIKGYHQIVGHNRVDKIMVCPVYNKKIKTGSITFCDCLDRSGEFYEIEI